MASFEELGFVADPYNLPLSEKIEARFVLWNRSDLADQRTSISAFVTDCAQGYKASLLAFGPFGAGKTWLGRLIEKEVLAKCDEAVVLKTHVTRIQPDFEAVYQTFVDSFLEDERTLKLLDKKLDKQADWAELFPNNNDLGNALYHIKSNDDSAPIARNWLKAAPIPAGELKTAGISLRLASPIQRYEVMRCLIEKCVQLFPAVLLVVDELENADPKFARELSDVLRELLDSFVNRFAVCCLFSGESLDEFYDKGYVDALLSRITHKIPLASLTLTSAPDWLKKHQIQYRVAAFDEDQLRPFTEAGLKKMLSLMRPEAMYPRQILTNCGHLARELKPSELIDPRFVENHQSRLEYLE